MAGETKIPRCIGVIVDGNRRWAKQRGLLPFAGHEAGAEKFEQFAIWASELGITHLIAYVFSSENWNRPRPEVDFLLGLFKKAIFEKLDVFHKNNIKVRVIGDRSRFSPDIIRMIEEAERSTSGNTGMVVAFAFSYGGREEILAAVNAIYRDDAFIDKPITKEIFEEHLWTRGIPDPDIIIRTSGEMRLSNFLPWQSTYSELFFLEKLWPDITREDLENVLREYGLRERRFGT